MPLPYLLFGMMNFFECGSEMQCGRLPADFRSKRNRITERPVDFENPGAIPELFQPAPLLRWKLTAGDFEYLSGSQIKKYETRIGNIGHLFYFPSCNNLDTKLLHVSLKGPGQILCTASGKRPAGIMSHERKQDSIGPCHPQVQIHHRMGRHPCQKTARPGSFEQPPGQNRCRKYRLESEPDKRKGKLCLVRRLQNLRQNLPGMRKEPVHPHFVGILIPAECGSRFLY